MKCQKQVIKLAFVLASLIQLLHAMIFSLKLRKTERRMNDRANEYLDNEVSLYQKRHIKVYCKDLDKIREKITLNLFLSLGFLFVSFFIPDEE